MKYPLEERLIWFKGELVPIREAKVMVFSPTAQFGLNVFEGIPCFWNQESKKLYGFRVMDHYARLIRSARLLQIDCPYTAEDMLEALKAVISANEISEDISVRQTLFVDDFGSWGSSGPTGMFVVPTPKKMISSEYNQEGLKACITSWRRISDNTISPRIKCGANYINSRMGQREALANGYHTCLFLNEFGKLAEGPGSCIFMVKNGKLVTPQFTDAVLESITRDSVIHIAKSLGYEVEVRTVDRTEIYSSEEAFLCGSAMGITPIYQVDQYKIGFEIGKITNVIRNIYYTIIKGENMCYKKWIYEL